MKQNRIVYIGMILLLMAGYVISNQTIYLIMSILLIGAGGISLVMLVIAGSGITSSISHDTACTRGEMVEIHLAVYRRFPLPAGRITGEIIYENALFPTEATKEIQLNLSAHFEEKMVIPYLGGDCGRITMHWKSMALWDMMGIFRMPVAVPEGSQFIVYPRGLQLAVARGSLPESQNVGEQYDPRRKGNDVTEVFALRDYQPGDSVRCIHWKLSSKVGRLVVRDFARPSNYDTMILYDTHVLAGYIPSGEMNGVLELAAALSRALLQEGHPHTTSTVSNNSCYQWQLEKMDDYEQMLGEMMQLPMIGEGESALSHLINHNYGLDYTKVIYVTTVFDERQVKELAQKMHITVFYLQNREEETIENGMNYQIITISESSLQDKVRVVEI